MLTRMLSVSGRVPIEIVNAVGPAKSVGRDRWIDFAQQIEKPSMTAMAIDLISSEKFASLGSDARFELLATEIKSNHPAKVAVLMISAHLP